MSFSSLFSMYEKPLQFPISIPQKLLCNIFWSNLLPSIFRHLPLKTIGYIPPTKPPPSEPKRLTQILPNFQSMLTNPCPSVITEQCQQGGRTERRPPFLLLPSLSLGRCPEKWCMQPGGGRGAREGEKQRRRRHFADIARRLSSSSFPSFLFPFPPAEVMEKIFFLPLCLLYPHSQPTVEWFNLPIYSINCIMDHTSNFVTL